jgi:acid stress-induced BolA-like protein IbaG/YrbA
VRPSVREDPTSQQGSTESKMRQPEVHTRSGRASRPAARWIKAMITQALGTTGIRVEGELLCNKTMFSEAEAERDVFYVFKTTTDPDTMYLHQAMKEPDKEQFKEARLKEVKDQTENKNFSIVSRDSVLVNEPIMLTVWQMKRKQDIITRQVKKWKARLNINGSKMIKGIHFQESYSSVATWNSIRTMLILAAQHDWHTIQIDYVLAFPQAPIERTLYMEIPKGFELEDRHDHAKYVLKLHWNVYGSKNAGRTWYQYLSQKLVEEVGFVQSKIDDCVYYKGTVMYVLYTDDSILAGPDRNDIKQVIKDIQLANLNITVEGDIQDFLGINISRKEDGSIHLSQPQLIKGILKDLRLNGNNTKIKTTLSLSSRILTKHEDSEDFDGSFDYQLIVGKLNYLEKGTRVDISYISHQCARFAVEPKKEHGEAIRWLGRYLKGTCDKGLILKPDGVSGLEVYVDDESPHTGVHCKLYEDNSGALEILRHKKYRPRTKHLLVKLHHFRDYVTRREISIHPIRHDQQADFITKPVNESTLIKLRGLVQGW